MTERGVPVDHSNIYRWVQKFTPPVGGGLPERKAASSGLELADG
jgi:transposase-like protein